MNRIPNEFARDPLRKWLFMREVEPGDVDVMLVEDGMMFRLPVGSDSIDIDS